MILISISTNFDRLHLIKRGHICSGMPKNALFPSIRNFNKSIKEKIEKTNSGQILKFIYRRIAFRNMFSNSFIDNNSIRTFVATSSSSSHRARKCHTWAKWICSQGDRFGRTRVLETYYVFMVLLRRKHSDAFSLLNKCRAHIGIVKVHRKRGEVKRFWNINHVIDVCFVWSIFSVFFSPSSMEWSEKKSQKHSKRESIIKIPNSISYREPKCTTVCIETRIFRNQCQYFNASYRFVHHIPAEHVQQQHRRPSLTSEHDRIGVRCLSYIDFWI